MEWACPQSIEDALWGAAKSTLPERAMERKAIVRAVVQRSTLYTSNREELKERKHQSPSDVAARALFFGVADVAKTFVPLSELKNCGSLPKPQGGRLRVLDLGAGAGAMSLGVAHFYRGDDTEMAFSLVDSDHDALRVAKSALEALGKAQGSRVQATLEVADVSRYEPKGAFDLIMVGSLLNELGEEGQKTAMTRALAKLAPLGALIIIEPALRETSRALHHLRDWIIHDKQAYVFAPCVRRLSPCPMLNTDQDWCHEERPATLPERAQQIANATGLRDGALKFSYLVLRSIPGNVSAGRLRAMRVVSHPRRGKGVHTMQVCDDSGMRQLTLQRRNRKPSNRAVERAKRGDLLVGDLKPKGEGQLEADQTTAVLLERPALD